MQMEIHVLSIVYEIVNSFPAFYNTGRIDKVTHISFILCFCLVLTGDKSLSYHTNASRASFSVSRLFQNQTLSDKKTTVGLFSASDVSSL